MGEVDKAESVEAPPTVAAPPITAPPLPEADLSQPDMWYVRPASGDGQYGPADTETIRGWAAEGRVSQESWVWRTGWPDWKKGIEALVLLNAPSEHVATETVAPQTDSTEPVNVAPSNVPRTRRSARRERARKITMTLSAVVFLLLVALALVLSR